MMADHIIPNPDEELVTQMDLVAFLISKCKMSYHRTGYVPNTGDPNKRVACWVFKKSTQLSTSLVEWSKQEHVGTKLIREYQRAQRELRPMKVMLEKVA